MWTTIRLVLGFSVLLLATSCSSNSVKRNAYQSVQTMEQRECLKQPGADCPQPPSYNQYEQQREETIKQ
jgi:hypothetical protein